MIQNINNTDYEFSGTVTATQFIGDGSALTGVGSSGANLTFLFGNWPSDIGGIYWSAYPITGYTPGLEGNTTTSLTTTPSVMAVFATPDSGLGITYLPPSQINFHYETQKAAGSNNYYTFVELYKRTAGGTETLIGTSDNSSDIALNTRQQISLALITSTGVTFNATDRLVIKIKGAMLSSTANVDVYFDDGTNSRIELPITTSTSLTLTTTGTSGAATLTGNTLNIPVYSSGGGGSSAVTQRTGTSIQFDTDTVYGTIASPETGNITLNTTDLALGKTALLIHNNGTAPTFASGFENIGGAYTVGVVNYINFVAINSTKVVYSISQSGGTSSLTLDNLSDVVISAATSGQTIKYNGSNYVNTFENTGKTNKTVPYVTVAATKTYKSLINSSNFTIGTNSIAGDTLLFWPVFLQPGTTIREFAARVNTTGSSASGGTTEFEIAIYNSVMNGSNQIVPGDFLVKSGKMSMGSTGIKSSILGSPYTLPTTVDNVYWFAMRNYAALSFAPSSYASSDIVADWFSWSSGTSYTPLRCLVQKWSNSYVDWPVQLAQSGGAGATQSETVATHTTQMPVVGIA